MLEHTHTHTHIHTQTLTPVFIYPNLLSDKRTYTHSYIYIYIYIIHIYVRFLYKHIVICVPSLIEIAPGVPELCLSGVIYHRILHWPETQKFRHFTVMWHRSCSARFTYLNTNGRMFVCTFQHNTHYRAVASIPICVNVTAAAIGKPWGGGGGSHAGLPHHPPWWK
jgi:hypothetical protein